MLVFLPGQDEITSIYKILINKSNTYLKDNNSLLKIYPLMIYSSLPSKDQMKIFNNTPDKHRKVILATNIAETSITIPNIKYVIDSGYYKEKHGEYLCLKHCSKVSAIQRSGRAGREFPGKCYRLYTIDTYNEMLTYSDAEILRTDLTEITLKIKAMKLNIGIKDLDLIDKPHNNNWIIALSKLIDFDAIDKNTTKLNETGKIMIEFPTSVKHAKMLISSIKSNN